ncbi:MAG: hypothetical protein K6U74_17750 [Firmicutes bacterium]|nr:hypothetical protein [Bacillota bacterium]
MQGRRSYAKLIAAPTERSTIFEGDLCSGKGEGLFLFLKVIAREFKNVNIFRHS